jgi:aromatic-L-amino-acid decarboxylase
MTYPLTLGAKREAALEHAAALVARAWREFDQAREVESLPSESLLADLTGPLPQEPHDVIKSLDEAAEVLDTSLSQARPRYLAYIGSSGLEVGALADLLAHSYDINLALDARAASHLDRQALAWLAEFLGFPADGGSFTSGGTISNITALAAARERAIPGSRASGLNGHRVRVYCSREAHYSVTRAAELLGIGRDNVYDVDIDELRRMDATDLERQIDADIADGVTPIAVIATGGTTLTGAVDPLDAIADVCGPRGVWLHVDGAYGLPAAASQRSGFRFAGLDRVDSLTVDAHKWLFVPKACSAILVRNTRDLASTFAHDEDYIPHEQETLNAVDITLEYSRPLRALKMWLAFRVHGAQAFRDAIDRNLAEANLLYELAAANPEFETREHPPQLSIVPIRHVHPGCPDPDAHNDILCRAIQADGRVYLSPAVIDGHIWLRPCFTNFRTTEEDVRITLDVAAELGRGLCPEH